jgi:2-deoxy-scyllo-inosamine dehydrogenase (SAM-dependent)/8-amino-3,8-dideoxy-alpha-D-manno-octulosonate transaminase
VLALSDQALKAGIPLFERMQIESQSNCNRSCWFCPRTYDGSGKYLDGSGGAVIDQMPTEKILDLLDQAQALSFKGRVGFHHYSEPLLDKRNILLAQEARKRGMKPYLHTNGDVLKHDDALCQEVKSVYGLIVVGLYDYKTNEELENTKQYWQEKLAGANLQFSPIGLSRPSTAYGIGIPRALVPSDPRMAAPDLTFANAPCHRPLIRMIIQYDGEMCNCCEDTYGAFKLGNVYRDSMEELWFSERHKEIIQNLIKGAREQYALCRSCPLPPTGRAPDGKKVNIGPRRYVATASALPAGPRDSSAGS